MNNILWSGYEILKVRSRSGILKKFLHYIPSQSPTYFGKTEGRGFFLKIEPLTVRIGKGIHAQETKIYQRKAYGLSRNQETDTLIISGAKVRFQISDTQFQEEPESMDLDCLNSQESQIDAEQNDDGTFWGFDQHYPHLPGIGVLDFQRFGNYMRCRWFAMIVAVISRMEKRLNI